MLLIRVFLWGLVAAMTLQGFLHADEYGTSVTLLGGIAMTMTVWRDRLSEGARALFWQTPRILPRAIVVAALRETARHPGLHTLSPLRVALSEHETILQEFREAEASWLLTHGDLIGGLLTEGHSTWSDAELDRTIAEMALAEAEAEANHCFFPWRGCAAKRVAVENARAYLAETIQRHRAWERVLRLTSVGDDAGPDTLAWLRATTHENSNATVNAIEMFREELDTLHDVRTRRDRRIIELISFAGAVAKTAGDCPWRARLMASLLTGEIWAACMRHVRQREARIRELIAATGVQDMFNAQERVMNASLRVAISATEKQTVSDWFGEIIAYAWWPGDDLPTIVRRCLAQEGGDCRRIGSAEVNALMAQMDEQARIVADWTRRLLIGMWNALPAVGVLFVVEFLVLIVGVRQIPEEIYLRRREMRDRDRERLALTR